MKMGPITATCFPSEAADDVAVEIRDLATCELIDRIPIRSSQNEELIFAQEVARIEALRARDTDWEPTVVLLVNYDLELDRKEIA